MKTYYKATRPDGKDFYSGTVDYAAHLESGKPLDRKPVAKWGHNCGTYTVYHASDVPSETLSGGKWRCRLFEVAGRPVDRVGNKFGFRSLRVVREIEAWRALGPNGSEVAALIERASLLTRPEADALAEAGAESVASVGSESWYEADDAVWDEARDSRRLAAWYAGGIAAWGAPGTTSRHVQEREFMFTARNVTRQAARVLIVRDWISEERFNILYGPWASVVG